MSIFYPILANDFIHHLNHFSTIPFNDDKLEKERSRYKNVKIYGNLETKEIYAQAIIDYISSMTDRYAITIFNELLRY